MKRHEATNILPVQFGDLSIGNAIWLTLTNLCNIHCKYCFNYVDKNNQDMSAELALNIIKSHLLSLDKEKVRHFNVFYFGGEPTLNFDALIQSVDFFLDNDVNCSQCIMTNGIFSTKTFNQLIHKNICFQVSYDGSANNLRYNKPQSKCINEETIEGIKRLAQHGEQVQIRATIHAGNVSNIPHLIKFCSDVGARKLMCWPICDFGDSKQNQVKQPEINEYIDNMYEAQILSYQYGVELEVRGEDAFRQSKHAKMNVPFVWLPDGYVAMTITYATSKAKGAEKIIIGKYDEKRNAIKLDEQAISQMKENYIKNVKKYCGGCPIKDLCRGSIHVTPFATDTFIPERDYYFCQLGLSMIKAFPARDDVSRFA